MRPRLQKIGALFIFSCKVGQNDPIVMKLKPDMSSLLMHVYTRFEIDVSKHVEESPENSDGPTDGRTLPRYNTTVSQTGI